VNEGLSQETRICVTPSYRLQWEPAQDAHVLLYPEGMVKLNPSAAEILKLCDGTRTIAQIIADLSAKFPEADLRTDVMHFLHAAHEQGWIKTI
jgi:pyrroloquinoline quinone biosynthesis protein D